MLPCHIPSHLETDQGAGDYNKFVLSDALRVSGRSLPPPGPAIKSTSFALEVAVGGDLTPGSRPLLQLGALFAVSSWLGFGHVPQKTNHPGGDGNPPQRIDCPRRSVP